MGGDTQSSRRSSFPNLKLFPNLYFHRPLVSINQGRNSLLLALTTRKINAEPRMHGRRGSPGHEFRRKNTIGVGDGADLFRRVEQQQ